MSNSNAISSDMEESLAPQGIPSCRDAGSASPYRHLVIGLDILSVGTGEDRRKTLRTCRVMGDRLEQHPCHVSVRRCAMRGSPNAVQTFPQGMGFHIRLARARSLLSAHVITSPAALEYCLHEFVTRDLSLWPLAWVLLLRRERLANGLRSIPAQESQTCRSKR